MKKYIIFDLDGTLLNTLDDLANSTNHALQACNYPTHSVENIRRFVGNGVANLIHRAMPQGCSDTEFQKCFAAFKTHYKLHSMDLTKPYPGIMPLLKELKNNDIKMAIVSNKLDSAVKNLCSHFFSEYIDVAIGEMSTMRRKPHPDMVIEAMRRLGATQEESIYIGDSEVDIQTARNTGIDHICVLWGFRDIDLLKDNGGTTFAHTPSDIQIILNK